MHLIVKVTSKAKLNKIVHINNQKYHIYTTTAPDKGKANLQIIKMLSKKFNVPKSQIIILKGKKSKNKIIQIQN